MNWIMLLEKYFVNSKYILVHIKNSDSTIDHDQS
jgi:hypothetical protein